MILDQKSKDAITKILILAFHETENPGSIQETTLDGDLANYMEKVMAKYHGKQYNETLPVAGVTCNMFYCRVQFVLSQILDVIEKVEPYAT